MKPTSKEVINELCKILDATPKKINVFMTPKEKAVELYEKMRREEYHLPAKWCALVAVDEQISLLLSLSPYMAFPNQVTYLQEVKQEIEKL
jgi:hypothetical protein